MIRLLRIVTAGALVAAVLVVAHAPLLEAAARFLIVEDPVVRAEVIVVLAGGRGVERVREAARLYHAGMASRVLLSGGEGSDGMPTPQVLEHSAVAQGIPRSALIYETQSTSTAEQARYLRPLLEEQGVRRALVVTSSFHTRRTRYLFRKAFEGSPVEVRIIPVRDGPFSPARWWTREQDTESVVLEYIKLGLAALRYR